MISMKTYQDLQALGRDENARMAFLEAAIRDHQASALYRTAVEAGHYYDGENPTIARYEKILYDMQGREVNEAKAASSMVTLHGIPAGIYILTTEGRKTKLIVK